MLARLGAYGNFFNFYLCSSNFRITTPKGVYYTKPTPQPGAEVQVMARLIPHKRFSERNPVLLGIIGSALLVLVMLAALSYKSLPFFDSGRSYSAVFTESGGLASGADVQSPASRSAQSRRHLDHAHVRVDFKLTDGSAHLGSRTSAAITTERCSASAV